MKKSIGWDDLVVALLVIGAIALVAFLIISAVVKINKDAILIRQCQHTGYADAVEWSGQDFCIGYNSDGAIQILDAKALEVQNE